MKKAFAILLLLITTATISAQEYQRNRKWIRDSLAYLIASPFDNWWINFSGGIQTFIGNEQDADARWNYMYHDKFKPNWGARIEVGKWVIPDVAVSLRANYFTVHSQGLYAKNPWLDPDDPSDAELPSYYPNSLSGDQFYHWQFMHGISATALVTLDWTNFLHGYERGKRRHFHVYTPIGMGGAWLFKKQINEKNANPDYKNGDMRWNKELTFTGGVMGEYYARPWLSINLAAEILGTRGTIDWTYTQDHPEAPHKHRVVDWIPSVYLGLKYNILRDFNKYNPETGGHDQVRDWGFETLGSYDYLSGIPARLDDLYRQRDSLEDLADDLNRDHLANLARLQDSIDALEKRLAEAPKPTGTPVNIFDELMGVNEILNLPSTVIYFKLDKYDIDYNARQRLQHFARKMKQLDDTLEFYLIGAADSLTGSIPHNQWLSGKRCGVTYNMLVKDFDVDPNQLIQVPVGGITEYEPQEYNRMAMLILRTPVTEEIVERWTRKRQQ